MRFPFPTITALLLTTVSAKRKWPNDCISCAALCAFDIKLCASTDCFTEARDMPSSHIVALCGLDTSPYDKYLNESMQQRSRVEEMPYGGPTHGSTVTGVYLVDWPEVTALSSILATDTKSAVPFKA